MLISMATANFFMIPFEKALRIIKGAGFEFIELDGYWRGGENWEVAQHIKDIPPRDVISMVSDSGLKIASFHDLGGVIEEGSNSVISPDTYEYLEYYDFPCIVFHSPHKRTGDGGWWDTYKPILKADLLSISKNRIICLENMVRFDGYVVSLLQPAEMLQFTRDAGVFVNIDTTHYAQCNVDIVSAAAMLSERVRTIHLSDYRNGMSHVYIGDGDLDFTAFYCQLDLANLYSTTIECNMPFDLNDEQLLTEKCRRSKEIVEDLI